MGSEVTATLSSMMRKSRSSVALAAGAPSQHWSRILATISGWLRISKNGGSSVIWGLPGLGAGCSNTKGMLCLMQSVRPRWVRKARSVPSFTLAASAGRKCGKP